MSGIYTVTPGTLQPWVRPDVTSASSHGTITWGSVGTSGTEDGWHVYDGDASSRYVPKDATSFLKWVLPYNVIFTPESTFVCKGRIDSSEGNNDYIYRFYADEAKTIPLTTTFSGPTRDQTKTITATITSNVVTDTIYLDTTGSTGWGGFTDINFTNVYSGSSASYVTVADVKRKCTTTVSTVWTQPVLTGPTSYGTCSDSRNNTSERQEGWRALDNDSSTKFTPTNDAGQWWQWTVPDSLRFTAGSSTITIVGGEPNTSTWIAYTDNTRTTALTAEFTCPSSGNSVTVPITTTATTSTIYLYKTASSGWSGMTSITFNNVTTETTTTEVKDLSVYKYSNGAYQHIFGDPVPVPFTPFVQPTLTSKGTMGVSEFAVEASDNFDSTYTEYRAFDDTAYDWCCHGVPTSSSPVTYTIYSAHRLLLSRIDITNRRNFSNQYFTAGYVDAGNGTDWTRVAVFTIPNGSAGYVTQVPLTNVPLCNYYRLTFTDGYGENAGVSKFILTGNVETAEGG